jgi:hypothetical protein
VCKTLRRRMENYFAEACAAYHDMEDCLAVVRCKDCDFRAFDDACKEYYCDCVNGINGAITDNAFCSYGERRSYE